MGDLDSNQDKQYQKLLCYRYTIAQSSHPWKGAGWFAVRSAGGRSGASIKSESPEGETENPTDHTNRGSEDLATMPGRRPRRRCLWFGFASRTWLSRAVPPKGRNWTCRSRVFPKSREGGIQRGQALGRASVRWGSNVRRDRFRMNGAMVGAGCTESIGAGRPDSGLDYPSESELSGAGVVFSLSRITCSLMTS